MKKLLTTTALVALVASSTASLAETKITGSIEQTFISTSFDRAADEKSGTSAIGQETNLAITNTKALSNGWTVSGGFRIENGSVDNENITLSNGGFSIHTGSDTGSNIHTNINPRVGEQPGDVILGEAASDGFDGNDAAHDVQHVGIEFKADMGKIFLNYAPDTESDAVTNGNGGNTVDGGPSITEIGFQGSLGVAGLNVLVGYEEQSGNNGSSDISNDVISASYTQGPVAVGFAYRTKDDGSVATNAADKVQAYSIAYKVSNDISVSYENVTVEFEGSTKTDEEYDQISLGTNFGGMGFSIDYVRADNMAGTAGADREAVQLRTVYSF
jgi:hypothetical protein